MLGSGDSLPRGRSHAAAVGKEFGIDLGPGRKPRPPFFSTSKQEFTGSLSCVARRGHELFHVEPELNSGRDTRPSSPGEIRLGVIAACSTWNVVGAFSAQRGILLLRHGTIADG